MLSFAVHFLATSLLSSVSTPIGDVFVDVNGANCSTGTGSQNDPVCSINDAIALALVGDTIHIAPGSYFENVFIGLDLELVGTGGSAVTIISGSSAGSTVTIPNSVSATLDGLTVTDGVAECGAGIRVDGGLTLRNSTVSGNSATGTGPGFRRGGGIGSGPNTIAGPIVIENCRISNNTASGPNGAAGGGIDIHGGPVSISNSEISGNSAVAGPPAVVGSFVSGGGGGISVTGGFTSSTSGLTLSDTTISGNTAVAYPTDYSGGGGLIAVRSLLTIRNSTISDNAGNAGGGISVYENGAFLNNTTITGNTALAGGGVWMPGPDFGSVFENVTITENSADFGAAVVAFFPRIRNSIISGNPSPGNQSEVDGSFISLGHNLIGTGGTGFTDGVNGDQVGSIGLPLSAQLGPLLFNGGSTETHVPLVGSPLIDAGDTMNFAPLDQRGVARPQGAAPDIGAVESEAFVADLCNGDGGDQLGCTECPCGNNAAPGAIGGCLNSAANSARLSVTGLASGSLPPMSALDLRFSVQGAPPLAFCLLSSGDALAPLDMSHPCFGLGSGAQGLALDGLRCAVENFRRHGGRSADSSGEVGVTNEPWGGEGGPVAGIVGAGAGFSAGQTRYFQMLNRDDPLSTCMRGLNTSQAIEITFQP